MCLSTSRSRIAILILAGVCLLASDEDWGHEDCGQACDLRFSVTRHFVLLNESRSQRPRSQNRKPDPGFRSNLICQCKSFCINF